MNNVYVLEQGCKYEGGGVVAVYGDYTVARADLEELVKSFDAAEREFAEWEASQSDSVWGLDYTPMEETSQDFFVNDIDYVCLSERMVYYNRRIDG